MRITARARIHGFSDEEILHAWDRETKKRRTAPVEVPGTKRAASRRDDGTGLDHVDPSTHPSRDAASFRRIIAARKDLEEAKQELRDAVAAAREVGDSWTVIGVALDTTRQAAYQRFGKVDA